MASFTTMADYSAMSFAGLLSTGCAMPTPDSAPAQAQVDQAIDWLVKLRFDRQSNRWPRARPAAKGRPESWHLHQVDCRSSGTQHHYVVVVDSHAYSFRTGPQATVARGARSCRRGVMRKFGCSLIKRERRAH